MAAVGELCAGLARVVRAHRDREAGIAEQQLQTPPDGEAVVDD
jgi:hypothetical protein